MQSEPEQTLVYSHFTGVFKDVVLTEDVRDFSVKKFGFNFFFCNVILF